MNPALPSWNDAPTKAAILDFVERVVDDPGAVPIEERIAVFDNDGTLWTEKPCRSPSNGRVPTVGPSSA
jgi:hypothetical protein